MAEARAWYGQNWWIYYCWETLVLIFQGDPWVHARDARGTDLMLAEEGSVRSIFLRLSALQSYLQACTVLSLLLHRVDGSVTLRMPQSADGTAFGDTLPLLCWFTSHQWYRHHRLRNHLRNSTLGKSLDYKWWQISHVAVRSAIFVTNSSSKGLISDYFLAEFFYPQLPSTGSGCSSSQPDEEWSLYHMKMLRSLKAVFSWVLHAAVEHTHCNDVLAIWDGVGFFLSLL